MEGLIQALGQLLDQLGRVWWVWVPLVALFLIGLVLRKRLGSFGKWLLRLPVVLLVLAVVGLGVINAFFFEPAVRWLLDRVGERSGIIVSYGAVEGSLWTGTLAFEDLSVQRPEHPASRFDFVMDSAELDLGVFALLRGAFVLETVHVVGLSGTYQRMGADEPGKPPRDYVIRDLVVENAQLAYVDNRRPSDRVEVQLDRLQSQDLHGSEAVFGVLFRSQAQGRFQGVPFQLSWEAADDGGTSHWQLAALSPARLVQGAWPAELSAITLTADVQSQWLDDAESQVRFDVGLGLEGVPRPEGPLASRAYDLLVDNAGLLRVSLPFSMDRSRFAGASSVSDTGFVSELLGQVPDVWTRIREGVLPGAGDVVEGLGDRARDLWDRVRNP